MALPILWLYIRPRTTEPHRTTAPPPPPPPSTWLNISSYASLIMLHDGDVDVDDVASGQFVAPAMQMQMWRLQNAKCTVAEDVIWAFFPLPTLNWPMSKSAATSWLTELETPPNQSRLDFYFLRADLYPFLGIYLFLKQSDCWKCLTNESKICI